VALNLLEMVLLLIVIVTLENPPLSRIVMAIATTAKIIQTAIKRIMEKIQRRRYQIIPQK